jgi:hypothetical protein
MGWSGAMGWSGGVDPSATSASATTWVDDTPVDQALEPEAPTTDGSTSDGTDGAEADGTASDAPTATLHVGDLDGIGVALDSKGNWEATVTVTVLDADNAPVEGATVSGTWGSCTTAAAGQCSLSSGSNRKNIPSVTFAVDSVTHGAYSYDPASNNDPAGDSDGTTITVAGP